MNLSFEALLILGVIGFYLYDSVCLVYSNQLVFIESFGKWGFTLPSSNWRIMGKLIYIANPFTPFNQTFIVTWSTSTYSSNYEFREPPYTEINLTFIRLSVTLLMYMMLMLLPVVIYKLGLGMLALLVLIAIYITITSMIFFIYIKRTTLKLSKKEVLGLAFEVISCPPFAINLLRRLSLKHMLVEEPIGFAKRKFDTETYSQFKQQFNQKLLDELEREDDESSPRSISLIKYRDKLMESTQ